MKNPNIYKIDVINNNIPLYAIIKNSIILMRSTDKMFLSSICLYLNNKDSILSLLKFLQKEVKEQSCKTCSPKDKLYECGNCKFKPIVPQLERILNELSRLEPGKNTQKYL